jgi:hypothetical protein
MQRAAVRTLSLAKTTVGDVMDRRQLLGLGISIGALASAGRGLAADIRSEPAGPYA